MTSSCKRAGWASACTLLLALPVLRAATPESNAAAPEQVIIDTDIGDDIDDAFALALALRSPEIKLLGITTDSGNTLARARIAERLLSASGHSEIPVGVGRATVMPADALPIGRQSRFGETGQAGKLSQVPAVDFILQQIHRAPDQITLVTIGPVSNVKDLIAKDPQSIRHLKRIVMMGGSIETGYGDTTVKGASVEWNIAVDIPAAQRLFESGVPIYMMPLDSTMELKLDEVKRDALFTKGTALSEALGTLYLLWGKMTPTLFDAMAVAYVVRSDLCPTRPMHIVVDDKGWTRAEAGKPNAQVCLHSDPDQFFRFYMDRFK